MNERLRNLLLALAPPPPGVKQASIIGEVGFGLRTAGDYIDIASLAPMQSSVLVATSIKLKAIGPGQDGQPEVIPGESLAGHLELHIAGDGVYPAVFGVDIFNLDDNSGTALEYGKRGWPTDAITPKNVLPYSWIIGPKGIRVRCHVRQLPRFWISKLVCEAFVVNIPQNNWDDLIMAATAKNKH